MRASIATRGARQRLSLERLLNAQAHHRVAKETDPRSGICRSIQPSIFLAELHRVLVSSRVWPGHAHVARAALSNADRFRPPPFFESTATACATPSVSASVFSLFDATSRKRLPKRQPVACDLNHSAGIAENDRRRAVPIVDNRQLIFWTPRLAKKSGSVVVKPASTGAVRRPKRREGQ